MGSNDPPLRAQANFPQPNHNNTRRHSHTPKLLHDHHPMFRNHNHKISHNNRLRRLIRQPYDTYRRPAEIQDNKAEGEKEGKGVPIG